MKQKKILLTAAALLLLLSVPTFADTGKITNINISVNEIKMEPGVVWTAEPGVRSNDYAITDYDWSADYEMWEPGKKITLSLTLESDEKTFDSNAHIYANNGEIANSNRSSTKKYRVKVNYLPKVTLQAPSGISYEDEYTLVWDKVDYAGGYEITLYKDGTRFKTLSVEGKGNTTIDLSEYATDDYLVTAALRAVAPRNKSRYIMASEWIMVDDEGISLNGDSTVYGQFTGSGKYKQFKNEDGNYASGWQLINGIWYYFNPNKSNYAITEEWFSDGTYYYLFDADGKMLTGWVKYGDYWYYLSQNSMEGGRPYGAMATGWVRTGPSSPYYYLNPGNVEGYPYGAMLHDTTTPDGYTVNSNGEWLG